MIMRKFTFTAIAVLFFSTAFAQKPDAGAFTIETQINLQTGTAPINIFTPNIRARYFISDGMALRLQFAYLSNKNTMTVTENADGTGGEGTITQSSSQFTFRPGIEKHFAGTNRLAPYIGAEINIQMGSAKESLDQASTDGYGFYYYDETTTAEVTGGWLSGPSSWGAGTTFGLNLLAGLDFYVTENLYLGGELGWGFNSYSGKDTELTVTVDGDTFNSTTPGAKSSGFGMAPTGFIRLGWLLQ